MKGISEKQFQGNVIQLARTLGWKVYFTWNSIHSPSGYPDLTLVRERIVFIELKREGKHLTEAQEDWARALRNAGGECYWFDSSEKDWELLQKVLDSDKRIT